MRFRIALISLVLLAVCLTGCRVDTTVEVNVGTDGAGSVVAEVRMDEQAAEAIGDVEAELRVEDLEEAGWSITGPRTDGDETVISARHGFDNPAEAAALIEQLGTEAGPFRDFEIRQQRSLTNVESSFVGTVDLTRGIESWGSPELQERTGRALGVDPEEVNRNLGVNLEDVFGLSVVVNMPGEASNVSPPTNQDGQWEIPYGQSVVLSAESAGTNWGAIGLLVLSALLMIAAFGVGIFWQTYKPKHRKLDP